MSDEGSFGSGSSCGRSSSSSQTSSRFAVVSAAAHASIGEDNFRRALFAFFLPEGAANRLAARNAARRATDGPAAKPTEEADGYQGDAGDSTDSHEAIQATESVVMDSIEHADPPAMIDEQEAAAISDGQGQGQEQGGEGGGRSRGSRGHKGQRSRDTVAETTRHRDRETATAPGKATETAAAAKRPHDDHDSIIEVSPILLPAFEGKG